MKAPKCRLCGHEHWNNQPHVFATNTVANSVANKNRPKAPKSRSCSGLDRKEAETPAMDQNGAANRPTESARVEKWRVSNRKRYNDRQRELMRLKRAGFIGIAYG